MFELSKEILDTHEALLTVVVEDKTVQQAMRDAARRFSKEISIPGFRRGKAPYGKVRRYIGEKALFQEAADSIIQVIYPEVIEQADIKPYDSGELEDMQASPLTFKIRVPLEPSVDLGDYKSLRVAWQETSISDEEMSNILEQVREEHAVLEAVDRPAELGDEVHINVVGTSGEDVVVDEDDIEVILNEDVPFLAAGFVEMLVGMQVGERKTFSLTFPEDIEEASLRGADVDFNVEVVHIYKRQLPELDDALASTVGTFETLDELKADIEERLLRYKTQQRQDRYRDEVLDALVSQADIRYPPAMIEASLDDIVDITEERMQRDHEMTLEAALRLEGRTKDDFRDDMRPQAERRLENSLVITEFTRLEEITVTDDEVVRGYTDMLLSAGFEDTTVADNLQLDSPMGQQLRETTTINKAFERMAQIARGEVAMEADVAEAASEMTASPEEEVVADDAETVTETAKSLEEKKETDADADVGLDTPLEDVDDVEDDAGDSDEETEATAAE